MTGYEWVSLGISSVALVVAILSWLKSNKLAKLQIQELEEKKRLKDKPKLNVAISKLGKSSYFVVANTGGGSAYQLNVSLIDCNDNPLLDASERLPHPELKPDSALKLLAAFDLDSALKYQVKLTWKNKSGKDEQDTFWVDK